MGTCGKDLTDEAEREALKNRGIGPATRGRHYETLFPVNISNVKEIACSDNKG